MKNEEILTDKEKRFLFLSSKNKLTLSEELEYARFKKEENFETFKKSEKYAFTTACFSAMMLPTLFMPSTVLPIAICLGNLGYLAYMEQTYFPKVKSKANYYFNILKANADEEKYSQVLKQNRRDAFDYSKNYFDRMRSVDSFVREVEKIDLDRKNGLAYNLMDEYRSLPRFRIYLLAASVISLVAGYFLPQMAFMCICIAVAGTSALLATLEANTTRKHRYNHWAKKEQQLEQLIYTRSHPFENAQSAVQKIEMKKVAHQQKQKMPDNSRQKED